MGNHLVAEKRVDRNGRLVTRHVRQETVSGSRKPLPSPSPITPKSEAQANAETVFYGLHANGEDGNLCKAYNSDPQKFSKDEISSALRELFSEDMLKMAAEVLDRNTNDLTVWMLRGLVECSEDILEGKGEVRVSSVLPTVIRKVKQAKVLAAGSGFTAPDDEVRFLMSKMDNQVDAALLDAANRGYYPEEDIDADSDKAYVSLLLLNIVSPLTTREIYSRPGIYSELMRIHDELDRILPCLPLFQERGHFSFELLDEMENSGVRTLGDGIL